MLSYGILALLVVLAEVLRRTSRACYRAWFGRMAKIPGPCLNKMSFLPWVCVVFQGNQVNEAPRLFRKYGDVVCVSPNEILISSKNAIHKVIAEDDLPKSPLYETLRDQPHITNLFTERDNDAYKRKRRLLSIGFSTAYTNGLEPLFQECIRMFTSSLQTKCSQSKGFAEVDFAHRLINLSFDIMSAVSFGGSFELCRTDDSKTMDMFQDRLMKTCLNTLFPFLRLLPFVDLRSQEMDEMIQNIIIRRRKAMEAGVLKRDLLQVLIDTHDADPKEFTMTHVYEEMRLFMFAGSETSAGTLTFMTLLLLNNPSKLRLLLTEIDAAFPNMNQEITFANTQNLEYLNACINETMRQMPIVRGGVPRFTEEATVLDGVTIPGETIIYAHIDVMMNDERNYPDAKSFTPERWLPERASELDKKAFVPFSAGLRNCPGQQFALKELRLVMATLLRKFELILVEGQSHEMKVHTTPYFVAGKYLVGVKPRN